MRERRAAVWTAGGFALVTVAAMAARVHLPPLLAVRGILAVGLGLVFVGMLGLTLAPEREHGAAVAGMAAVVLGLGLLAWPRTGVLGGATMGAGIGVLGVVPRLLRDTVRAARDARQRATNGEEGRARGGHGR